MKKLKEKSVLYSYLISFVSIALISCVLVSVIGYMVSTRELRRSATEEQNKRLMLAAEDVAAQVEHLQKISYSIQVSSSYQPSVITRNPWYEVELLRAFEKIGNDSELFSQYFMRYQGHEAVYSGTGKDYLENFSIKKLGLSDGSALREVLDACTEVEFFPLSRGALLIFPLRMAPLTDYTGRATVCFYLEKTALIERAQLVSSEKFTHMAVYFDDACVIACEDIENAVPATFGRFTLVFDKDEIGVGIGSGFMRLNLQLTTLLAILLCVLAVYVAIYNYLPILKIARRYNLKTGKNELDHLDQTLIDIEGKLRISQEQLEERVERFKLLRNDLQRYFVMKIVQGEVDEYSLEHMRDAGLYFPAQSFYAFVLQPQKKITYEKLERIIDELSDDQAAFYVVPFGGRGNFAVLANADSGMELRDILIDACTGMNVFGGKETEVISEVPSLLFDALTEMAPSYIKPTDIARCREDERLRKLRKALEVGDEMQALESLKEYCAAYAEGDQTIQQLIHNNVTSVLLSASYEANMSVPHAFLRGKDEAWEMTEYWIAALCNNKDSITPSDEHKIIRYLREHMLDYNLSLESVAEYFHRSTRQITRIVQAETGGSYKEFILRLRMEYAKDMLRSGASVAETCDAVCYVSRSHFIKTFTNYTGMTPSRFKEQENKSK